MSVFVTAIVDRVTNLTSDHTLQPGGKRRARNLREVSEGLQKYARARGVDDQLALVAEARRLADDLRMRTGVDHSDPEWWDIESSLSPVLEWPVRVAYAARNAERLIPALGEQIERMERELAATPARV